MLENETVRPGNPTLPTSRHRQFSAILGPDHRPIVLTTVRMESLGGSPCVVRTEPFNRLPLPKELLTPYSNRMYVTENHSREPWVGGSRAQPLALHEFLRFWDAPVHRIVTDRTVENATASPGASRPLAWRFSNPRDTADPQGIPLKVTLRDWFGASRSANARLVLASKTGVSWECRVSGGRAQRCAHKNPVCATTPKIQSAGSRDDGRTRDKGC